MGRCVRWWLLLSVVVAAGCHPAQLAEVTRDDPDSLFIAVSADRDGLISPPLAFGPGQIFDRAFDLSADGGRLITFELTLEDVVRSDGAPVSVEDLKQVEVTRSGEASPPGTGAGLSCAVPSFGALQVVTPGDRCLPLLPRTRAYRRIDDQLRSTGFEELGEGERTLVQKAQASLRLLWPGERPTLGPSAAHWTAEPIGPKEQLWPPEALAQASDGTAGLFSQHLVLLIPPNGDPPVRLAGAALPFRGVVWAAVATSTSSYVVFAEGPAGTETHLLRIEAGGPVFEPAIVDGPAATQDLRPNIARWHGDRAVVVGALMSPTGERPAAWECSPSARGLVCTGPTIDLGSSCRGATAALLDYTVTPRGPLAVSADAFFFGPSFAADSPWSCALVPSQHFDFDGPIAPLQPVQLGSVGSFGGYAYACVKPADLPPVMILEANVEATAGPFGPPGPEWHTSYFAPEGVCGEFYSWGTSRPTTLRVSGGGGAFQLVSPGGGPDSWCSFNSFNYSFDERCRDREPTVPWPYVRTLERTPGWTMSTLGWPIEPTLLGSGLVVRPSGGEWRHVFGRWPVDDLGAVVARSDDVLAFHAFTDAAPLVVRGQSEDAVIERLPLSGAPYNAHPGERIRGALWDRSTNEVYVYGGVEDQNVSDETWPPFIKTLSADLTQVRERTLPLRSGEFFCDGAELRPGQFVLVGGDGVVVTLGPEGLERVPVNYDDPETPAIEEPPVTYVDAVPHPHLYAVSAVDGVAWAVGRGGLILRIHLGVRADGSRGLVAERVALDRIGPQGLEVPLDPQPLFTHVAAVAPDRVFVFAQRRPYPFKRGCGGIFRGHEPTDQPQLLLIAPHPDLDAVAGELGSSRQLVFSSAWPEHLGAWPQLPPGGLVPDGDGVLLAGWDGLLRSETKRWRLPFPALAAHRDGEGRLWVVGSASRFARLLPSR